MIRDDFAGPGGWEQGLLAHGRRDVLGVELDPQACATARAAGHHRLQADVLDLPTRQELEGYLASPPCQPFAAGGTGAGRIALAHLRAAARQVVRGAGPAEAVAAVRDAQLDQRSVLVLHPLAVVRDSRPRWVALEQVPAVLPVWETYAHWLTSWGYAVTGGLVRAEQYGVPQTRKRAVLLARLGGVEVQLPPPTHARYGKGRPRRVPGLEPWVSMADALGWGMTDRPSVSVVATTNGTAGHGGPRALDGGTGARRALVEAQALGCWAGPTDTSITAAEAGVLQTFPPDYPWQGTSSQAHQQVGNAVPPSLAAAMLSGVLSP